MTKRWKGFKKLCFATFMRAQFKKLVRNSEISKSDKSDKKLSILSARIPQIPIYVYAILKCIFPWKHNIHLKESESTSRQNRRNEYMFF